MSPCTRIVICVLASLFMVCEIRPLGGHMHTYNSRLCASLSTKARRQRSKLCQESEAVKVVRMRRDVNTTRSVNQNITETRIPIPTTKRPSSCEYNVEPASRNGFSTIGQGLELDVRCAKDGLWWSAVISWEIPKPQSGRDDCTGYVVKWENTEEDFGGYCDSIRDKNVTSYFIDSSKGWRRDKDGSDKLRIVVFPLPPNSSDSEITYRNFEPPSCSDSTTQPPLKTTLTSTENTMRSNNTDATTSKELETTSTSTKNITRPNNTDPVVNKLVFSIVIASIAILILAIIFALWRKRQIINNNSVCKNYEFNEKISSKGAAHYISYDADNKNKAIKIASWLQGKKVNVIIDKFFVIKSNERAWSEQQLLAAEKIIMIITPRYLEICTLYQATSNKEKKLGSFKDELVHNEISLMKNKMADELATKKFMGILIDISKKDLPHWMSQLKCFHYKNGKLDEEILSMLKPCNV